MILEIIFEGINLLLALGFSFVECIHIGKFSTCPEHTIHTWF
jgi:hypothetical protein